MIIGVVNANLEAIVRLTVRGESGQEEEIDAVIDTGFTGSLTLTAASVASLKLLWRGRGQTILGDGSVQTFDIYSAAIVWDGQTRTIEIDVAEILRLTSRKSCRF